MLHTNIEMNDSYDTKLRSSVYDTV